MKIWFQNRRMKWRNSKERELIAHGGSREQTLPTKHNPNPDLSDPVASPTAATAGEGGSGPGDPGEQTPQQSAAAATQSLHRIWSEAAAAAAAAAAVATPLPPLPPPQFATSAAERMRLVAMQATDDADASPVGCGGDDDCEDGDVDGGSDGGGVIGDSDDSEDEMEEINVT